MAFQYATWERETSHHAAPAVSQQQLVPCAYDCVAAMDVKPLYARSESEGGVAGLAGLEERRLHDREEQVAKEWKEREEKTMQADAWRVHNLQEEQERRWEQWQTKEVRGATTFVQPWKERV